MPKGKWKKSEKPLHLATMSKQSRVVHAICLAMLCSGAALAQQGSTRDAVRAWRTQHEADIIRQYFELLSLPNVASDKANILRNADRISELLQARGVKTRLLPVEGAPPIVYGELNAPGATRTIGIYAHYDGQPVDPSQWASAPWHPRLLDAALDAGGKEIPIPPSPKPGEDGAPKISPEARIYARSASDDKAPIQAILSALDALKAAGAKPSINLKFFFEGEEEAGSPHLPAAFQQYAELLRADAWLLCDGPVHQTRRWQLYFGARGVTDVEITLYGPARVLHSGHYGNWAPNPAAQLANLLASLRDRNGRITIPGYSDQVKALSASELAAIKAMPPVDAQLKQELALDWTESDGEPLALAITHPALNVRGIQVGNVGNKAQNAIATEARASIDFRMVPDQTPERVRETFEAFLTKQGYWITHKAPTLDDRRQHPRVVWLEWGTGYPAAKTSMDLPVARAVVASMESVSSAPVIRAPLLGGSIPMYLWTDVLKTPVIGLPIANHDNNQHGANENLRIQNLWDGIEIFAAIFTSVDKNWAK
jgi:acetylornithine deacetylase/succinyl-diaminopimelate desuccinylase-like protein